jgi:hypothetical protein
LTTQDNTSDTTETTKIGVFSMLPLMSAMTTKPCSKDKVNESFTDPSFRLDLSTDRACPTAEESCGSHDLVITGSTPTKTNTSSDLDVKSLQQTLGNLQDFLWNCKQEATPTAPKTLQSIRDLASIGTMPHPSAVSGQPDKPLAELFTDTTVLFADIAGTIYVVTNAFSSGLPNRFLFPPSQDSQLGAPPVNPLR